MPRDTRLIACLACHLTKPHHSRGLCGACYHYALDHGRLDEYPPIQRTSAEVAEDAEWLAADGLGWRAVAARLGYSTNCRPSSSGLRQALKRARRLDVWERLKEAA